MLPQVGPAGARGGGEGGKGGGTALWRASGLDSGKGS